MKALVYTTRTCAQCPAVKKYLDILGIPYQVIDVTDRPQLRESLIRDSGYISVPITQYGTKYVAGYKPSEIKEMFL